MVLKSAALAGLLLIGSMAGAQAATIFTEDFSGATEGQGYSGNLSGTQFTVTSGNVDVLGPGLFGCVGAPGAKCVDLIGGGGQGAITSTAGINIVAGTTYTIQYTDILQGFAIGNTPSLAYTVSLGSHILPVVSIPTVTLISLQFTAAVSESAALLVFAASGGDGSHGPVISGLTIDATVAATPLPAALPLFASALAGMGFVSWRRKRSAA